MNPEKYLSSLFLPDIGIATPMQKIKTGKTRSTQLRPVRVKSTACDGGGV